MPTTALTSLLTGYDYVTDRLLTRLDGLGEAEYLWEPVPGSWSVREVAGSWQAEFASPDPVPAPVTTIAWRLWHIADCLAGYVSPHLGPWPLTVLDVDHRWHPRVAPALDDLRTSIAVFRERMVALGEEGGWQLLGPAWGPFAESTWIDLFVHAFDEVAHHGAEVALLRDLYLRHTA
ncbi:DinB family protein [Jatrophihabitans sp.]|uniref:DinB family protein n=1 Tax=Jatrophihabitans sp. TaxID=1932789 RepID=UPI0030C72854|nr:hypothetical protein [Jatrophihabitans sp.]